MSAPDSNFPDNSTAHAVGFDECSRPACCLTEAGLECTDCSWRGCEESATPYVDEIEGVMYMCPICTAECAHTPLVETTDYDGPCVCGEINETEARP